MKWKKKGHQFDYLGKKFEKRNRIFIYGSGDIGKWVYRQLKFLDCIDGYIDRDENKQRTGCNGLPVYSPNIILKNYDERHLIVIAIKDKKTAVKVELSLLLFGYIKNYDFFYFEDFVPDENSALDFLDNFYLRIYSVYAKNKIWLDSTAIYPTTICNLRCKYCLNFTPYIKHHCIKTLEECKQEVDIFFKWVDYVRWFQISGGEPQLWSHLYELIEYIGENYRSKIGKRFEFVTNGTIIPSDELFQLMRKYNVNMVLDDYGENYGNYKNRCKEIIDKLKENDISYIYSKPDHWFDLGIFKCNNRQKDLIEYFSECAVPFNANEYGKLYLCPYANFAIKAEIIKEDANEFYDLNSEITPIKKKQLTEFTLGYSNMGYSKLCERCSGWDKNLNKSIVPVAEQME